MWKFDCLSWITAGVVFNLVKQYLPFFYMFCKIKTCNSLIIILYTWHTLILVSGGFNAVSYANSCDALLEYDCPIPITKHTVDCIVFANTKYYYQWLLCGMADIRRHIIKQLRRAESKHLTSYRYNERRVWIKTHGNVYIKCLWYT